MSETKKAAHAAPADINMPTPPKDASAAPPDINMPTPPKDAGTGTADTSAKDAIETKDINMPAPPALDLDGGK